MLLFARQFVRDLPTAEDIVHDAFLAFWPHRDSALDPKAYLYTTIRHTALQHRRGANRRDTRERSVARSESDASLFITPAENDERQAIIQNALGRLPEAQRLVVTLKIWGGLTFAQIGEALGIPGNTAASRWRAGVDTLRQSLAQEAAP